MTPPSSDPVASFTDAMTRCGITTTSRIIPDGKLHRIHVEGDRRDTKNGYYVLHLDGRPAGMFGCHERNIKETWKANGAELCDFRPGGAAPQGRG